MLCRWLIILEGGTLLSGEASKILLAGFDGYSSLKRTKIIDNLFYLYSASKKSIPLIAITPTTYSVPSTSIFVL